MAWKARLRDITKIGAMVKPVIEFTNGDEIIVLDNFQGDNLTLESLALQVQRRIQSFEARDVAFEELQAHKGREIELPRDKPPIEE